MHVSLHYRHIQHAYMYNCTYDFANVNYCSYYKTKVIIMYIYKLKFTCTISLIVSVTTLLLLEVLGPPDQCHHVVLVIL